VNGLRVRLARLLLDPRVALSVPLLVGAGAAVQQVLLTRFSPLPGGLTHYNNFLVFRLAFVHLVEGRNLYLDFPGEHFDNFLYSPTFAVLMAPFSVLPVEPSLVLWNVANALVMVAGIRRSPAWTGAPGRSSPGSSCSSSSGPRRTPRPTRPSWGSCSSPSPPPSRAGPGRPASCSRSPAT
jgi:hypothetical protein